MGEKLTLVLAYAPSGHDATCKPCGNTANPDGEFETYQILEALSSRVKRKIQLGRATVGRFAGH